ncbi:MAG TPA: polyhydroxyalkanoate synthesis regulator DNA-binding domain-containing protein [Kofleriaceae bacterium]|nr:polyhydroxyalkanoate synthesis regulator DNA-binding domain-containing protein [Kofleriaceae bacterium]
MRTGGLLMAEARIIKRYANRKLYDTQHSRYVTLDQISEMIRAGDDVKIVDNKTKEDLTSVTLAQIIFEEEKKQRSFLPLTAMRNIIQNGGEWFAEAQRRVSRVLPFKRDETGDGATGEGEEEPMPPDHDLGLPDDDSTYAGAKKGEGLALMREFREWVTEQQHALEDWQKRVDGRVRGVVENITPFGTLHKDVKTLSDRIAELEAKLLQLAEDERKLDKE